MASTKKDFQVDIYVRERYGNRYIYFPWLPEKISFESGGIVRATYNIMNSGPVEVPTGSGLSSYSWEGIFPGIRRPDDFLFRSTRREPKHYHSILEDWRKNGTPLYLMVIGYPISKFVILDSYSGEATGAFGDISYKLKFIEDRDITIETVVKEEAKQTTTEESKQAEAGAEQAEAEKSSEEYVTYKIVDGDNLYKISTKIFGAAYTSVCDAIYELNKDILDATAREHGHTNSNKGWWIYPGTVIKINKNHFK